MESHSNILAWRIPWTEKPDRLQSIGVTESDDLSDLETHTCNSRLDIEEEKISERETIKLNHTKKQ